MRTAPGLRRPSRAIGWLAVAAALALGGAGIVGQVSHPPGDSRREELTYTADVALKVRLDALAAQLTDVGSLVDGLSGDAKASLVAVTSGDGTALQEALERGTGRARSAESTVDAIRTSLAGLPGEGPAAAVSYANATLVRRADLLAALDAVGSLSDLWDSVTGKAAQAASLTLAIRDHDATVANAASLGVQAQYQAALDELTKAAALLSQIAQLRAEIVTSTEQTVLDDWISRHDRYDRALATLYQALKQSGGKRSPTVDEAYRQENLARQGLPPDNRQIVVIVAEVAQAGLNQAVVAIEDARGRIDEAVAAVQPG
ncbi:MAG: hypothetical protein HY263_10145 [Chloroflexi bacterium]|nr:hypothetical protein [Chloroflexota bacterium]